MDRCCLNSILSHLSSQLRDQRTSPLWVILRWMNVILLTERDFTNNVIGPMVLLLRHVFHYYGSIKAASWLQTLSQHIAAILLYTPCNYLSNTSFSCCMFIVDEYVIRISNSNRFIVLLREQSLQQISPSHINTFDTWAALMSNGV